MKLLLTATALFAIVLTVSAVQLFVHTVSWNSGDEQAPKDLNEFVGISNSGKPDVVAVAVQGSGFHTSANSKNPTCIKNFNKTLKDYVKVSANFSDYMGMAIFLLKKHQEKLTPTPKNITVNFNQPYTSGGIAMTFTVYKKRLTFITSRMTDKDAEKGKLRRTYYPKMDKSNGTKPSDFLFWFGNLNFRVKTTPEKAEKFINQNDINGLFAFDQFKDAQAEGLFEGWKEETIRFKPTYKFKPNTDNYNLSTTPSWTDRVFYKSGTGKVIEPVTYNSLTKYKETQHRPVVGEFYINV